MEYVTMARKPINEGQLIKIAYGLVIEMSQLKKYCCTWRSKAEAGKTWMEFQYHFIEAQAKLNKRKQTYH